jgi:predicted GNAT family acetyltransferase
MHPLDTPIWSALTTQQRLASQGDDAARAYLPDIGPLCATRDNGSTSLASLGRLVQDRQILVLLQVAPPETPPGCRAEMVAPAVQMVLTDPAGLVEPGDLIDLGDDDAPDMLELATLTQPGPFAARTHTLGRFRGVRGQDGRLLAMSGERMRLPGYTEVSGVCTHPDARGQGLAGRLMSASARDILARGETPFLHAYTANTNAIRLYKALGFSVSRAMTVVKLVPA